MKKAFLPAIFIFLTGCNTATNTTPVTTSVTTNTEAKKDSFFPVTSFIKGQLLLLDSLPVTPLHTTVINNKTDSVWIKKSELVALLQDFLSPEIKETNLINYFKETSFMDQTINAITFTYDPLPTLPDSISLRHWDIYIDPESDKISKIYLVKQFKEKEGIVTRQLTWKTNKWASINTIINMPNGNTALLKAEKFIWNFNE